MILQHCPLFYESLTQLDNCDHIMVFLS